jgi:hypothetical protein
MKSLKKNLKILNHKFIMWLIKKVQLKALKRPKGLSQYLVTPIVQNKNNMLPTSTYPMWCNVIPPFMHVNPGLYLVYPTRTKGFDPSNFRNCTCYVFGYVCPILE